MLWLWVVVFTAFSAQVFEIKSDRMAARVLSLDGPAIVMLHVDWCHICTATLPKLVQAANECGAPVTFLHADITKDSATKDTFGVSGYPGIFTYPKKGEPKSGTKYAGRYDPMSFCTVAWKLVGRPFREMSGQVPDLQRLGTPVVVWSPADPAEKAPDLAEQALTKRFAAYPFWQIPPDGFPYARGLSVYLPGTLTLSGEPAVTTLSAGTAVSTFWLEEALLPAPIRYSPGDPDSEIFLGEALRLDRWMFAAIVGNPDQEPAAVACLADARAHPHAAEYSFALIMATEEDGYFEKKLQLQPRDQPQPVVMHMEGRVLSWHGDAERMTLRNCSGALSAVRAQEVTLQRDEQTWWQKLMGSPMILGASLLLFIFTLMFVFGPVDDEQPKRD